MLDGGDVGMGLYEFTINVVVNSGGSPIAKTEIRMNPLIGQFPDYA